MAAKIKIITARDFIKVTPDGIINLTSSKQLLIDTAKTEHHSVDSELLIDFRNTKFVISIPEKKKYRTTLFRLNKQM